MAGYEFDSRSWATPSYLNIVSRTCRFKLMMTACTITICIICVILVLVPCFRNLVCIVNTISFNKVPCACRLGNRCFLKWDRIDWVTLIPYTSSFRTVSDLTCSPSTNSPFSEILANASWATLCFSSSLIPYHLFAICSSPNSAPISSSVRPFVSGNL